MEHRFSKNIGIKFCTPSDAHCIKIDHLWIEMSYLLSSSKDKVIYHWNRPRSPPPPEQFEFKFFHFNLSISIQKYRDV